MFAIVAHDFPSDRTFVMLVKHQFAVQLHLCSPECTTIICSAQSTSQPRHYSGSSGSSPSTRISNIPTANCQVVSTRQFRNILAPTPLTPLPLLVAITARMSTHLWTLLSIFTDFFPPVHLHAAARTHSKWATSLTGGPLCLLPCERRYEGGSPGAPAATPASNPLTRSLKRDYHCAY
ncbi:hypothetical protein BU25DRAFT_156284 [Macroventuria anomochaeta]|uniref:Uncharacterized protein n=1 Tax=Macroventuria anomochaeta TaxID=301207 RepID=A0ACB6RRT5_9PLEO|nr:uncharacterized protein BU25DRAFT_156284 [Macroventuria anomochaeta]KAF2624611.1 hypothetical protein BU25DRAFT_156284 [Macroventuria anomochaeta]